MKSYEEMVKVREELKIARTAFNDTYYEYLKGCLEEAGYLDKLVRVKDLGVTGMIKIEPKSYPTSCPFEFKFYPIKKNGELSLMRKYAGDFYFWNEDRYKQQLKDTFEPVGDYLAD